jgi:superoxide dismutase, Fe-Mn family
MKNNFFAFLTLSISIIFISCNRKEYTEVVEVPLPEEKVDTLIGKPNDVIANEGNFKLNKIPNDYATFEPAITNVNLEDHYARQYLSYLNKLNEISKGTEFENIDIVELLKSKHVLDIKIRNYAGGYFNHNMYFKSIATRAKKIPNDSLQKTIIRDFGSFKNFETNFKNESVTQIGSNWVWLLVDKTGKLQISSTNNNDNPYMPNALIKGTPILNIDLWEHAYYLGYQNSRSKYVDAYFSQIDWKVIGNRFEKTLKK